MFRAKTGKSGFHPGDDEEQYQSEDQNSVTEDGPISAAQFRKLFFLNIGAALFQTISAVGIFFLIDDDKTYSFYTSYPLTEEGAEGNPFRGPDVKESFSINIGYLTATFLALSALDHLIVCTCGKNLYERGLDNNYNAFRWIEYALSASLMRVLVGVLSGFNDLHAQFLLFGCTACTMLFGLVFELENSKNRLGNIRWYTFVLGFIPHFFAWVVVIGYFFYGVTQGSPPAFVYAIIFIIFFLDLSFALILWLQWRGKGRFRSYVTGETAFIILSFTSKNLLAWINFFGGNR
jgi:hypothetical protein